MFTVTSFRNQHDSAGLHGEENSSFIPRMCPSLPSASTQYDNSTSSFYEKYNHSSVKNIEVIGARNATCTHKACTGRMSLKTTSRDKADLGDRLSGQRPELA